MAQAIGLQDREAMIQLRSNRFNQAEKNDEPQKPNVKELQQLPRPFTTPATISLCRNLRPPENFVSTLAGIAAAVHSGADSDDVESPQAYFHARRPTTTGGARSARRQKLTPLATTRKPPGELRRTDVREYGTLDRLLHPDLHPVAEEDDDEPMTNSTSKVVTIEDIESIMMNKAQEDLPDYLLSHKSHRKRRKHTENSLQPSFSKSSLKKGWQSSKSSSRRQSMVGSRRPSMAVGSLQRRGAVFGGPRLVSDESTDSDSSDSESADSSSQSSSRSLLRDISGAQQASDWHSLIQLARERSSVAPAAGNVPTDESIPSKSLRASPIDELLEDDNDGDTWKGDTWNFQRDTITTDASTKRKLKGKSKGARPRSPLRPGVYVGHEARKHALVLASRKKPPPGLPDAAQAGDGHADVEQEVKKEQLEEKDGVARNKRVITWNDMVRELEDQRHADEAKQYNAWRKRVIECARNMQMEVSRFKLDER